MGDKKELGKGYARGVSAVLINYCFKEKEIRKINLDVLADNLAAYILYKKMGFVQER